MSMKPGTAGKYPDRKVFAGGEALFNEGDLGDRAFLVESGLVHVFRATECGHRVIGQVGPGGIVGEMALIDGTRRMASAVAAEATSCLVIQENVFKDKLKNADPFLVALLRMLVRTIRSTELRFDAIERGNLHPEPITRSPIVSDRAAPDKAAARDAS